MNKRFRNWDEIRRDWEQHFIDFYGPYGMTVDFSDVRIPEKEGNERRCIFIPEDLTANMVFAAMRTQGIKVWTMYPRHDLDEAVYVNTRTATHSYAVWIDKCVDEVLPSGPYKSTAIDPSSMHGVTLLERLVYGFKFFTEHKKHLDELTCSRCGGSRDSGGNVPHVDFDHDFGEVRIVPYDPKVMLPNVAHRGACV